MKALGAARLSFGSSWILSWYLLAIALLKFETLSANVPDRTKKRKGVL